jgi:hypothetical protein
LKAHGQPKSRREGGPKLASDDSNVPSRRVEAVDLVWKFLRRLVVLCVAVGRIGEPDGSVREVVSVGAIGRVLGRAGEDYDVVDGVEGAA